MSGNGLKNGPDFYRMLTKRNSVKKSHDILTVFQFSIFPLPARYVPVMQKITTGAIHEIPTWSGQES